MHQVESLSKQNQMLFDENIILQDRLLEMNSALHTSKDASSVLSNKEAAKQLPILKTNTTNQRQGTKGDMDSDEDFEQLRERLLNMLTGRWVDGWVG